MSRITDGKNGKLHFQTNRLVQQNGQWFYVTREGEERGPFESKADAEGDIAIYIRNQLNKQAFGN